MPSVKKTLFAPGLFLIFFFNPAQRSFAQNIAGKSNDQIEFLSIDSVKIFISSAMGRLEGKSCADLYRVAKVNRYFQFEGDVIDYYTSNNTVATKGNYREGSKQGEFRYYYTDGKLREKGEYQDNRRQGKWEYYYPNGQLHKLIDFIGEKSFLVECYSESGKILAKDANGLFEGDVVIGGKPNFMKVKAKGQIVDGLLSGKWELKVDMKDGAKFTEYFDSGVLQEAKSKSISGEKTYKDRHFSAFESIHPMDALDYYTQADYCFFGTTPHQPIGYGSQQLGLSEYYPELKKAIMSAQAGNNYSGWIYIENAINKKGNIEAINFKFSQDPGRFKENLLSNLFKLDKWVPAQKESVSIDFSTFMIVLVEGNEIVIPELLL